MTTASSNGRVQPRRVILLGKGELAVRVADWFVRGQDWELTTIVPTVPEPTWTDSLIAWAETNGVPYVESGRHGDLAGVKDDDWSIDLAVSVFYDRIIPAWFIDKCGRIINIHNSPLPRYRGVSPINWALKNRENMHGVTIHEITPGIDDGPIVAQTTYSIYPEVDEVIDVYRRGLEYAWVLFQQTLPLLDTITARPQDESQALYYSRQQDDQLGERRGFTRQQSVAV
jgi:methionyl-tRNA formyltransferase